MARVRALHPYETPEIIASPVSEGDPGYLRWIEESVSP
jgi:periplasmic divalent cation tolerance protein